ncbi:MAG TPA: methyltransferase domain-containing protein [Terriglobia bacterium]|nr:methyltransferase domain-containing protein [Terriglobia bacterium]
MKPRYLRKQPDHRQTMTNYYHPQAGLYDSTRWIFLYGRERLIQQLDIRPGERVLEVGCGTGKNFDAIQQRLQGTGEVIGVDCSKPMLRKAAERVREKGWKNVRLVDMEYGKEPVTRGKADVIVFSYSLSMIPDWELALACAQSELWPGGRIGVVDFYKSANGSRWFEEWLAVNHVNVERPYEERLRQFFRKSVYMRSDAWAGLWSFYLFIGVRPAFSTMNAAA